MASRKKKRRKRRVFKSYAEAMGVVEELASKGDKSSIDYKIALNAAADWFIVENEKSRENSAHDQIEINRRNWMTIQELIDELG